MPRTLIQRYTAWETRVIPGLLALVWRGSGPERKGLAQPATLEEDGWSGASTRAQPTLVP
jgi:hypothetical protein